jgi:uncharacterized protein with HEPN domain
MSEREWKLYLKDVAKSIDRIIEYIQRITDREDFFNDYRTYDAVMRNIGIIGEAVKHIPTEIKEKYEDVHWKKIAGLRDIAIHEYFGIDKDIIWDVVKNKIPGLKLEIDAIIKDVFSVDS